MVWAPDYVTSSDVKAYLRITDTDDDAQIALYITTASRAVDAFCKRQFGKVDESEDRTFEGAYDRHLGLYVYAIDDLASAEGLTFATEAGVETIEYTLYPRNALAKGKPYTELRTSACGPLTLTSDQWGWAAVPSPAKVGALLQAARLSARRGSPFGVAGSPSEGSEIRLLASLDPDLRTALRSYRREVWAA